MLDEITKALAGTLARAVISDEAGYDLRRTAGAGEGVWWAANVQGYAMDHKQALGFKPSAPEVLLAAAQVAAYFERHAEEIRAAAAVLRASDLHRLGAALRAAAWLARYGARELLGSLSPDGRLDVLVMRACDHARHSGLSVTERHDVMSSMDRATSLDWHSPH